MTKQELVQALKTGREDFMKAIDGLSETDLEKRGVAGDWSVKDILSHLSLWEAEMVKLLWELLQGLKPNTAHFSKRPVDELNETWYRESQHRTLDQVLGDFEAVRKQTLRRVEEFSEIDLNQPNRFQALGRRNDSPLLEWIESDSFGHEAEHAEQILAWRKLNGI